MKSTSFERFGGWMAIFAAIAGFVYAVAFVVLKSQPLSALFLALLDLFAIPVLLAIYSRVRETEAAFALCALLFGLVGAVGTAIHGGYDLANAINPPASVASGLLDLPSQIDPRGLLTFGFTGIGLFAFAGRRTPRQRSGRVSDPRGNCGVL